MTSIDKFYQAPLKIEICETHKPFKAGISFHNDVAYTFCEECENNIESYWMDFDSDRLSMWSDWKVSN